MPQLLVRDLDAGKVKRLKLNRLTIKGRNPNDTQHLA